MTRWHFPEFTKFLSVGVLNTLVGLASIYAGKWFFDMGDIAANATGYAIGLCVSYSLNSKWTFAYQGPHLPALVKFLMVAFAAYCMNLLTVMLAIHYAGLNGYLAQAMGIPPYTLTSYFASKYVVFHPRRLGK